MIPEQRHWTIRFDGFLNEEQKRQLRLDLEPVLRFVPAWVIEVWVKREEGDGKNDELMSCNPDMAYRRFVLSVYDNYFAHDDVSRRRFCMHEMVHCMTAHAIRWVDERLIEPVAETNSELYKFIRKEWIDRIESMTEELTSVFIREMEPAP